MSNLGRLLTRSTGAALATLAMVTLPPGGPAEAAGDASSGGDRRMIDHTVRPGETATGLAVRYHAWTAELIAHNHLGRDGAVRVGQHLEIPVVVSAAREARHTRHTRHTRHAGHRGHRSHRAPRQHATATATVRRTVARAATRHGVDPHLALAVSWQESGWRMDRRSGAGAIGAMQVLPQTAAWMSLYAGRRLHPHRLADNATAGVQLLRVLDAETGTRRRQVGAYYQGLGAVREHGLYRETRHYVDNVLAIRARLATGRPPA